MAWCGRGNTGTSNMYTTDVNNIGVGQLSGGQVVRGDFNGDGVEDKIVLGGGGAAGNRSYRTAGAYGGASGGFQQTSAGFGGQVVGGGLGGGRARGASNATNATQITQISNAFGGNAVGGGVGGGMPTIQESASFGGVMTAGSGGFRGGRSIGVNQLAGGQVIKGDFNGDGVEDTLILGQNRGLRNSMPKCNAGPERIVGQADLGVSELRRGVVSRTQGRAGLQFDGYRNMTIDCPATKIVSYKVKVPVQKSRVVQEPEQYTYTKMVTKNQPWQREVKEPKWVTEEVRVPVHTKKTIIEDKPYTYQTAERKMRLKQYYEDVPQTIKTQRKVTYQINEPFSTYETRQTSKKVPVQVPQWNPQCDTSNVITSPVDLRATMPGAGMRINIGQLSPGQTIRGDFNNDGIEDKLRLGGGARRQPRPAPRR